MLIFSSSPRLTPFSSFHLKFPLKDAPPTKLAAAEGLERRTSAVSVYVSSINSAYLLRSFIALFGHAFVICGLRVLPFITTKPSLVLFPVAFEPLYSRYSSGSASLSGLEEISHRCSSCYRFGDEGAENTHHDFLKKCARQMTIPSSVVLLFRPGQSCAGSGVPAQFSRPPS